MANFATRIKDLTGFDADTAAKQASINDWLTAGAREIIDVLPLSKLDRMSEEQVFHSGNIKTTSPADGVNVEDSKILHVLRAQDITASPVVYQPCREVHADQVGRIIDENYMEFATSTDPAYYISNKKLFVLPDHPTSPTNTGDEDCKIVKINEDFTVTYDLSTIENFPKEGNNAVVLYAARNAIMRLMNDIQTDDRIDNASTGILKNIQTAVDAAELMMDKFENVDEDSVFGDEDTFTTANSQITRVKDAVDKVQEVITGNAPSADTSARGAQSNEDTELVASALAIANTELKRAQTHLAEWNSIGDMRIKEVQGHLAEAGGYVQELTARINRQQAKYQWYTQQYTLLNAQFREALQLIGVDKLKIEEKMDGR